MATKSITKRLLWTVILSQGLLAVGLGMAGVVYTQRRLQSTLDAALQARAISVAALVRFPESKRSSLVFEDSLVPPSIDSAHPDFFEVLVDGRGLVASSSNWPSELSGRCDPSAERWDVAISGVTYRMVCLKNLPILDKEEGQSGNPPSLTVIYSTPTLEMQNQIRAAEVFIALASFLLLGGTISFAVWGVRRGMVPLQQMAERASQVSAQNWEFQLPQDTDQFKELQPLTQAIELMLKRLQQSFLQQREFLGNAAHELKTPVTILKSTLQSLAQKPRSSEECRAGFEQALEDMERLEKLLQWMLRLARAEQWARGTLRRDLEMIDISATCEEAVDTIRSLAAAKQMQIDLTTEGPAICRADPDDLKLVWINLLENAVRYSPAGTAIKMTAGINGRGCARVTVKDQGPGISEAELSHIFERFHRGDPSRARDTGGFGLGLSISKALVEAYGGTIAATSSVGRGTQVTVELPLDHESPRVSD